jgi:hypothetical protein
MESNITSLSLWRGDSNIISKCNISSIFLTDWSNSNLFVENNILSDNSTDEFSAIIYSANRWDNGSIGNYWSNYLSKYPNVSEVDNTGIGDTPYKMDENNIDNYPLMYPYDGGKSTTAVPTRDINEHILFLLIACAIVVLVIGAVFAVFHHRKSKQIS